MKFVYLSIILLCFVTNNIWAAPENGTSLPIANPMCVELFRGARLSASTAERLQIYRAMFQATKEKVGEQNVANFLYGAHGEYFIREIRRRNLPYEELLGDPGIVFHSRIFFDYLDRATGPTLTAHQAQIRFRAAMGTRRVFRAIAIPNTDFEKLKAIGLQSSFLRSLKPTPQGLSHPLPQGYHSTIEERTSRYFDRILGGQDDARNEFSLSVSHYPFAAVAPALAERLLRAKEDDYVIGLFEFELSKVDIVYTAKSYLQNIGSILEGGAHTYTSGTPLAQQTIPVPERMFIYGPDIESFVYFHLLPHELRSARIVTDQIY